jgi:hypothetical protein
VRGRLRWVKPCAQRTNKPPFLSHPISKVLGDQGTDHQATGAILPERKMGVSPIGGVRETAQRLPHTQAVRPTERSASVPCAKRVEASTYQAVNRVAPGSSMEGRERKRVTAPSHGAVWSLSSRLG